MNSYNVGDTLTFQSLKTGKIETNIITKKENFMGTSGDLLGYPARIGRIYWRDIKDKYQNGNVVFVSIDNSIMHGTNIFVNNIGKLPKSFGYLNKTDTLLINNRKVIDYYKVNRGGDHFEFIWQQKYGLVKFYRNKDDVYVRINIR